ncbi:GCN5 family acetyltransferase [Gaetbulibacter sp. 4G1]|nr:GCN5 family acetyltransferase [Gaetbulibacter sp. 4G1]PIA81036.1 GCN5 family acetyltransferase [Gaetbulibacter sp. 4G1]
MYPKVENKELIGNYPALVKAGGGYVWDEVLEYRVWCHPEEGAEDLENGNDYFYVFSDYVEALQFCKGTKGAEKPIALILQKEYIDEPEKEKYIHIKKERLTEWPVEFLNRPRRNENTIPNFLSPNAPSNRLEILRGVKK